MLLRHMPGRVFRLPAGIMSADCAVPHLFWQRFGKLGNKIDFPALRRSPLDKRAAWCYSVLCETGNDGGAPGQRYPERGASAASALYPPPQYHSRAARDNRAGPARYSGHERRAPWGTQAGWNRGIRASYLTPDESSGVVFLSPPLNTTRRLSHERREHLYL